jgi:hypothetical protein
LLDREQISLGPADSHCTQPGDLDILRGNSLCTKVDLPRSVIRNSNYILQYRKKIRASEAQKLLQHLCHLCFGFPQLFFPLDFPNKSLYAFLLSSMHSTCPAHYILLDFISLIILETGSLYHKSPHHAPSILFWTSSMTGKLVNDELDSR